MLDLKTDYLFLCLALILLWEHFSPREVVNDMHKRWLNNFSLHLANVGTKWLIIFLLLVIFDYEYTSPQLNIPASENTQGNIFLLILSILALDLFSYTKHRIFHHYQILWCTHLVHHSDLNIDVTTSFRHHPFEEVLSYLIYALFIYMFKLPIWTLGIYAVIASVMQLWHHSNTKLPRKFDNILSWVIITPYLHRLHHSAFRAETNSNYGTLFSFWDRLFGTLSEHKAKEVSFNYGLEYFREEKQLTIWSTLKQPLNYKVQKLKSVKQPRTD